MNKTSGFHKPATRPQRWAASALILMTCSFFYLSNGKTLAFRDGYDSLPSRVIPFSVLRYHTLTLDPFRADFERGRPDKWYLHQIGGHLLSAYPIGTPILALPFYVPAYAWLVIRHRTSSRDLFDVAEPVEKIASVLITALAAGVLFNVLLTRVSALAAALTALAFGLATPTWSIASQILWQHGPSLLCITLGLFFLSRDNLSIAAASGAGLWLGFTTAVRPQSVVFLAAGFFSVLVLSKCSAALPRTAIAYVCGAAPILAVPAIYNLYYFGTILGGYSAVVVPLSFSNLVRGGPGLLASPNRGLLVFSPVALVGLLGLAWHLWRPRRDPLVTAFSWAAIAYFLIHAAFQTWAGGWTFGPRYLTEIMPILALAAAPLVPKIRGGTAVLVGVLAAWSFLVQADGAFCYPAADWNGRMGDIEAHAWDFRHWQILEEFTEWRRLRRAAQEASPNLLKDTNARATTPATIAVTAPAANPGGV